MSAINGKAPAAKAKHSMSLKVPGDQKSKSSNATGRSSGKGKERMVEVDGDDGEDGEQELDDAEEDEDESLDDNEEEEELDTDEEIQEAQQTASRSKKTQKRKRRATSPSSFGATLQSLLGPASSVKKAHKGGGDEVDPSSAEEEAAEGEYGRSSKRAKKSLAPASASANPMLALAPHLKRSVQSSKLSAKAARALVKERKARLELTRVKDVIGGWGAPGQLLHPDSGEVIPTVGGKKLTSSELQQWEVEGGTQGYEKRLRKVAQRGVVKLFNAIKAAQGTSLQDVDEARQSALVRSVMPKGSAVGFKKTAKDSDNMPKGISVSGKVTSVLGGKQAALKDLSKDTFLELIKSGGGKR